MWGVNITKASPWSAGSGVIFHVKKRTPDVGVPEVMCRPDIMKRGVLENQRLNRPLQHSMMEEETMVVSLDFFVVVF